MSNPVKTIPSRILFEYLTPSTFRVLLAALVVAYHVISLITLGHYAVYVFFMLSGYWIARMYSEKYRYYKNSYFVYIVSRLARLMPIYWFVLLLTILVFVCIPSFAQKADAGKEYLGLVWTSNILVTGVANSPFMFIATAWSLDIEIQFYILAPLLLLLFRKKWAIPVFIITSLLSIALVLLEHASINVFIYLPYFIIGMLIYHFNYEASKKLAAFCLLIAAGILAIHYAVPFLRNGYLLNKEYDFGGFKYAEVLNILLVLLTIPYVSINVRLNPSKQLKGREQLLSSISYVLYLVHWPALQVYVLFANRASGVQKLICLIAFFIVSFVLSYLLARYVDTFFEKQRRKWLDRQQKRVQPLAAN